MKTIGILGGMSAESTQLYYAELCRLMRDAYGDLHSPEVILRSVNFSDISVLQSSGRWEDAGRILNQEALNLERGGAELVILATNTMHKVADQITNGLSVPFIHIADATAKKLKGLGKRRPGLMATCFTMEDGFYVDRLRTAQLAPVIPESDDRKRIHQIIYEELCQGQILQPSKEVYRAVADRLVARGADSLILGCTEIGMLLQDGDVPVMIVDSTLAHCEAAFDAAVVPGSL